MMKKRRLIYSILLLCLFLYLSGCASGADAQNGNILAGTSWISADDGSQMVFNEDESFGWYQSKEEKDDNYYAGTYDFYVGQDAMDYLTGDLAEYEVTKEEMQLYFDRNEEYGLNNFVCFTLNNQSFLLSGEEQLSEEKQTHYFGFLLEDGTFLDIANMITATYHGFSKE